MKTKVRVQYSYKDSKSEYEHCYIDILDTKYKNMKIDGTQHLESIGTISWQGTLSEKETRKENYWYALTFICSCERNKPERLVKMGKLATFIQKHSGHDMQPEELMLLIGAEKYIYDSGNYIPESYKGMEYYKVMKNGEYQSGIYAANQIVANNILNKKIHIIQIFIQCS